MNVSNAVGASPGAQSSGPWVRYWRVAAKLGRISPLAVIGLLVCLVWAVVALFASGMAPADPLAQSIAHRFLPPGPGHWLGTDLLGRDVLSRIIWGSRVSLPVGAIVVFVATAIGVTAGAVAGAVGGWLDEVIMRVSDLVLSFPAIVLAMAIAAALGPGLVNSTIAIVAVWWPRYARVMRSLVLSVKENEYVQASRALGATGSRTLLRVILPNSISPVFVLATMDLGNAILTFAGLGFLGLGQVPPNPEWGAMVAEGSQAFQNWWVGTFPGLAILSVAMGFNFIGDALGDLLDPRIRHQI